MAAFFTVVCGKDSSRIQKALPNANAAAAGGLLTAGSGANQINADGTGAVPIALGTTLPTNPTANTTGEAFFAAGQRVGRRNTAQSGTTSTITLDASASASDNLYRDYLIKITSGTGAGQFRTITSYVGSTKAATVDFAWATTPDATSVFAIFPQPVVDVALWNGAAPNALISGRVDSNAQAVASNAQLQSYRADHEIWRDPVEHRRYRQSARKRDADRGTNGFGLDRCRFPRLRWNVHVCRRAGRLGHSGRHGRNQQR